MLIKTDPETFKTYFEDSSNLKGGHAEGAVFPQDIDELSNFLNDNYPKKTPVTISAGGTGTAGARIPFGGYLISMERFNNVIDISKANRQATVQAGLLVEDLKNAAEKNGLFYASHPTERTAFVGGTVATNASGSRSFKYGPTRKYIKRLKMVLSDGEILEVRRGEIFLRRGDSTLKLESGRQINIPLPDYKMPDIKNSAGYFAKDGMDLIDLFIGQEGTLSVIAEIELELVEKPSKILSAFVFFREERDSWNFAEEAKRLSRSIPSKDGFTPDALSIEYFDHNALRLLSAKDRNVPKDMNAAIFFEQGVTGEDNEDRLTEAWLKLISRYSASLDDTWVAMNEREARRFTELRHAVPETINDIVKRSGFQKLSTDIAVPDDKFGRMMNFYVDTFKKERVEHVIFGHIGESHVHVNILPKSKEELAKTKDIAFEFVNKGVSLGGTVSAEHGIGKTKHRYLEEMYGKAGILEMARIKKSLDPNCILGLDNIFPKEILSLI
ncbi:MAG: FAD-binding oxidoreductase [Candidatus Omnitrophica bacterium]|nr:FAD-binding oxidoreductase [Candidatus Omnitrophota bacterium]